MVSFPCFPGRAPAPLYCEYVNTASLSVREREDVSSTDGRMGHVNGPGHPRGMRGLPYS